MGKVPKDSREAGDDHNPETDHLNPLNYPAPHKHEKPDGTPKPKTDMKTKVFWSENMTYVALLVWRVNTPRQGAVRIMKPLSEEELHEGLVYLKFKKDIKDFCDRSNIPVNFF